MHILTVIGARPQFVKAAVVSRQLQASGCDETIVHTGQHYDEKMSDIFFTELQIHPPDYNLMVGSGLHGQQTGKMLEGIEQILLERTPDLVLVYGDTNSTLAGALAAAKLHVPVAHVEAGLRSFNRRMPEEINRVVTDHLSTYLFAPTDTAVDHLRQEGIPGAQIYPVGDVMYDAALHYGAIADQQSQILAALELAPQSYALATVHRAENTDNAQRLPAIFDGLLQASRDLPIVLPLHPRTRAALLRAGLLARVEKGLRVIDPVGYLDMIQLEKHARLIVTDSGGVQKEAFFYRVPCVTLRDETEWVELVELGYNRLVSPENAHAVSAGILAGSILQLPQTPPAGLYGEGRASARIAALLQEGLA